MQGFVAASQEGHGERSAATGAQPSQPVTEGADRADPEAERRALRRQEAQLREERRPIRERRRQEDAAWQALRAERNAQKPADPAPSEAGTSRSSGTPPDRDEEWRALCRQRRETLAKRREEDALWRQQRQALRQALAALPVVTAWVAVLVIIDNCTRQCLGLPLFVVGPNVTAEMVVEALRLLLPAELQFLISDRGVHFTAQVFEQLMQELHILHVFIARHRPQSNGIAERFIRTLKEWLADKSWQSPEELVALLKEFLEWYNQRPHQGLPRPGVSPNEYAYQLRQALLTGSPPTPTPS